MKKISKIFRWLPIIFFSIISCNNDLDLNPISSISATSFWESEDDATGALYGMYHRFREVTNRNLFLWGEARSQSMEQSLGNDFSTIRIFENTLDANEAGPSWYSLYQVVNDANLILKHVPDIEFLDEGDKSRIIAEAYSMRAFCYFIMAKTWGEAILVTEPTEGYDATAIYKERSPVADIFNLIKSDIDKALNLFPNNDFTTGRNRWSKPSANALKGDVYLWTGKVLDGGNTDINTALNALSAIESSNVSLLPEFKRIFDYDNKGNSEILFSSNFQQFESESTFMSNMYFDQLPPNPLPSAAEVLGIPGGASYWTLTDESLSEFSEDDQRKDATFIELYSLDEETGLYTEFYACIQVKFDGLIDNGTRYFLDDVIVYRYADVLLMKAEAENALGIDPSVSMNKIRQRAYGDNFDDHVFINGTQAQNDALILNERLLELFYEGKRWWDVIRFNKTTELVPYFRDNPSDDYKLLWPIGLDILSLEPEVEQNPGYQGN